MKIFLMNLPKNKIKRIFMQKIIRTLFVFLLSLVFRPEKLTFIVMEFKMKSYSAESH